MISQLATLNLTAIREAYSLIQSKISKTPVYQAASLSRIVSKSIYPKGSSDTASGAPKINVFLKCENLQKAGSFKFRGASHFLAKQNDRALRKGLVTYSTGNHAIALAQAATFASAEKGFPIPLTILMPKTANIGKINMIERLGAIVTTHQSTMEDCAVRAEELRREAEMTLVPPSGHPYIVLGQGTAMLEFQQQIAGLGAKPLDVIIIPSAGGALLAGVALVCKEASSPVDVFGAEPLYGGAALSRCRQEGHRVVASGPTTFTIADGLCSMVAKCNWEILRSNTYVRDVFSASDDEIRAAMRLILEDAKQVVEPSAAVPLAALMSNNHLRSYFTRRKDPLNVGIILSGGNISVERLFKLLA
ncbi:pyridoxal-5'-phosphate-dependent enzyme [Arthroderma uncinatum]|uniref:pyridoxal-5'-phosphate-dependent enzyme n=1 Tax=Arthroderma uncinatum TaxID=74035 RepID=UPI00144A69D1|nr:pyridoxal-5'-phosphate-dependent enzyme [Arthroderma uncinatum]KAF3492339.1 pyridoxal-5'-phosphate-dependent enzyme [Arthroderma uncinatum]